MSGIIYAFHVSKTGKTVKLEPENYTGRPEKDGFVWLHFDRKNPETEVFLECDETIDAIATRNLLAEDSRPRTILHEGQILLNLRGVNLNPDRLSQHQLEYITPDNQLRIREAADQATRVNEELEAVRERCAIVKDQLTDMRAEEMNRNMMILSVVAAIFLPLGLISGMFGINVGGMPWTENASGFWMVTIIVFIIAFIQLIAFKILKWI